MDPASMNQRIDEARLALANLAPEDPDYATKAIHLGTCLEARFQDTGDAADLDQAIDCGKEAVAARTPDDLHHASHLRSLVLWLEMRYKKDASPEDLDQAIDAAGSALEYFPRAHTARLESMHKMGWLLVARFKRTGSSQDISRAIELGKSLTQEMSPDTNGVTKARYWKGFISWLLDRFNRTRALERIDELLHTLKQSLDCLADQPEHPVILDLLVTCHERRFRITGEIEDLDQAVEYGRLAVDAAGDGPARRKYASHLATALSDRFVETGLPEGLVEAIELEKSNLDSTDDQDSRRGYVWSLAILLLRHAQATDNVEGIGQGIPLINGVLDSLTPTHADRGRFLLCLSDFYTTRFAITEEISDLDRSIAIMTGMWEATERPWDHPQGITLSTALKEKFHTRFSLTGKVQDIDRAITIFNQLTESMPEGHWHRAEGLRALVGLHGLRVNSSGDTGDIDKAIEITERALSAGAEDARRIQYLNILGTFLKKRFERTSSAGDLDRAIEVTAEAVRAASVSDASSNLPAYLTNLSTCLSERWKETGAVDDLDYALELTSQAIESLPENSPDRAVCRNTLSILLQIQYERTSSIEYLDEAIKELNGAVESLSHCYPNIAVFYNNLGSMHNTRFQQEGHLDDLNKSIEFAQMALSVNPSGEGQGGVFHRPTLLSNLATRLAVRYEQTGGVADLEEAIQAVDVSIQTTAENHISQPEKLHNLASLLIRHSERTGDVEDLNRAVSTMYRALELTPVGRPYRTRLLCLLGQALNSRFLQTGNIEDLHQGLQVSSEALGAMAVDTPERIVTLVEHSDALQDRFNRLGDIEDLNQAIDLNQQAVDIISPEHRRWAPYLTSLASKLAARFEMTQVLGDLDRAIAIARVAAQTNTPPSYLEVWRPHHVLGVALGERFRRTERLTDIDEAVEVITAARELVPALSSARAQVQVDLAAVLWYRYDLLGNEADLDGSLENLESVIIQLPTDSHMLPVALNRVVAVLYTRYRLQGDSDDLDIAYEIARASVNCTPPDNPARAIYLENLASILIDREAQTRDSKDRNQMLHVLQESWSCSNAAPVTRMKCGRLLGLLLTMKSDWKESASVFAEALGLLPALSPRSLSNADKQYVLMDSHRLASLATAAALNAGKTPFEALRLLEQGRGVIAGLLLDIRTDISELTAKQPGLAAEFLSLRDRLDTPSNVSFSLTSAVSSESSLWEKQATERRENEQRFRDICDRIRLEPGFENFLLPPTEEQMMNAAQRGAIVVVNVSDIRSDAFLIRPSGVTVVDLLRLESQQAEEVSRALTCPQPLDDHVLESILEWAWHTVAQPCLEGLGYNGPPPDGSDPPQVRWIMAGPLAHLPIHAAGLHAPGSTNTVMDRVMSSYTSSIKSILHGRQSTASGDNGASFSEESNPATALLIAMQNTAGQKPLQFAQDEITMLEQLCPTLSLHPVQPTHSEKQAVLDGLKTCRIFHFAGHGMSHGSDASASCLLLHDWQSNPLTVADLRDNWLLAGHRPFLAYLSACSTGTSAEERLVDEAVHLVGACQLAGFRHVVGTLWAVSDRHSVDVARVFYETLRDEGMTDYAVCKGVHLAICRLRDMDVAAKEVRMTEAKRKTKGVTEGVKSARQTLFPVPDSGVQHPRHNGPTVDRLRLSRGSSRWLGLDRRLQTRDLFAPASLHHNSDLPCAGPQETVLDVFTYMRDVLGCDSDHDAGITLSPRLWAPYFHFGV
ncbi:CHAT domain-containing protein [Aspergillus thermomutatus]|uniref:CHAT domain-containing protein n=1 Tax=Aspergillus thermomutatus TaxID=41047 RepID=A0A397HMJ0_ASPTH|nr:uncharacterized protein CDV56_101435 [Aspergillus thermomutatus]RHZ62534.1 hypothetical protein CDV56_101435 [Aspergillus thermomutatus]